MEWASVEKGSPLWKERQEFHWKSETERMFIPWPVCLEEDLDARREWIPRHLEVPFLRYPRKGEGYTSILDI
jgi:hypothetical protein